MVECTAKPITIGTWTILVLPKNASAQLPSRGQVMVKGTINNYAFQTALEPDGKGSHWLHVDKAMQKAAGVQAGKTATLAIEATKEWPEPDVPADIRTALGANAPAQKRWAAVTPMARWEWIRWINATANQETRARRITVALSKLNAGEKRPCCFNRSMCCVPEVSKNGVLFEPTQAS